MNAFTRTTSDAKTTAERNFTPTYRPVFVPPKVQPQTKPKTIKIDTSNIAIETKFKNKAFGIGVITDKGQAYIYPCLIFLFKHALKI